MLDLWRFSSRAEIFMKRNFVQLVTVLLLAMHGVIAFSGSAGLHKICGCTHHHGIAFCSDDDSISHYCHHACHYNTNRVGSSFVQATSCRVDPHNCPICQWWYSYGHSVIVVCDFMCSGKPSLTGMVGEAGVFLSRPDYSESYPRGPPLVLCFA